MIPAVLAELDFDNVRQVVDAQLRALFSPNLGTALEDAGAMLAQSAQERINSTKTAPDGSGWAPWSAAYAARTKSRSILLDTDRLMHAIDSFVQGDDEIHLFAETPYAAAHQFGYENIPARPYLGVSEDDSIAIAEIIGEAFLRNFEAAA